MNILVVNDDGYQTDGIKILAEAMKAYGNVYIVAPHNEQSARSAAITIHHTVKVHKHSEQLYSVEGTPADCVRVAIKQLNLPIDLVVSGINNGFNIGIDTIYSGTIGAAMQGLLYSLPSLAFSADYNDVESSRREIDRTLQWIFNHKLYSNKWVLNVNFPASEFTESKDIKVTYVDIYRKDTLYESLEVDMLTDHEAVYQGYTSVTPLKLGNGDPQLNKELLEKIKN